MIRKIWDRDYSEYDETFDRVTDTVWKACRSETMTLSYNAFWEKYGDCSTITEDEKFIGLNFKNEGSYMLFLLEWA